MGSSSVAKPGVRREWMYAVASSAQRLAGRLAFEPSAHAADVRQLLASSVPSPANDIEEYVLEGLIARAERIARQSLRHADIASEPTVASRAAMLLRERYAEPWTLPRLAHELATNRYTLTTEFHARHGVGVHHFLLRLRIAAAQQRLLHTSDKIETIAHDVGFRRGRAFYRAFADIVGETPAAFRRAGVNP